MDFEEAEAVKQRADVVSYAMMGKCPCYFTWVVLFSHDAWGGVYTVITDLHLPAPIKDDGVSSHVYLI